MTQPTRTTTCLVAHFEGYIDDICDIQDDPQLNEDIKTWMKDHPEYDIHLIKYEHPGSSGYPLCATIHYKETTHGRSNIETKYGDEKNLFVLRNLETGHIISLRRHDCYGEVTRFTLKDKKGCYVVEEECKTGGLEPHSHYYSLCGYCGRNVDLSKAIWIDIATVAHEECVPRGLEIKNRHVVGGK